MTLKDVLDLGTTGVLAVAVIALWTRLNIVTDRFISRLDHGDAADKVLAQEAGIDTQRFEKMITRVKQAERDQKSL